MKLGNSGGGSSYANLESPFQDDDNICPSLSFKQRMIGFAICLAFAVMMEILAIVTLFQQEYVTFGIVNTIANIFALSSTLFLSGPKKQVKKMFDETRRIATVVYLLTMVLTFVVALAIKIAWLVILMVIVQYLAMLWYSISYIPFARDAIKKLVGC